MTEREKMIDMLRTACDSGKDCSIPCFECVANHLVSNGVTLQNWIPVSERLPERGQEVIIYTGNIQKPTVLAYQFWNPKYDTWAHVTHWMPLPTPPEGE